MSKLVIGKAVGQKSPNDPKDVKAVAAALIGIGKIDSTYVSDGTLDKVVQEAINDTQQHWMKTPDGVISVNGATQKYINAWQIKSVGANVSFNSYPSLQKAWDLVNPILPSGSRCTSAYRSTEKQRAILQEFFTKTYKAEIVKKYTQKTYDDVAKDLLANEAKVVEMVRGIGQAIAAPGTSMHEKGKAIDLGGAAPAKQIEIVKLVAKANSDLFSGKVIQERNGCVHFEIK